MHFHELSTAQQIRLWFIGGVEALSFIFIIIMTTAFNYYPDLGITESNGDTLGIIGWLLISQVAVITLGIITFLRFLNPKSPEPKGQWVPTDPVNKQQ
jgi:uncharacterized BrkB/YihY/UPF0761 family membrane protein